MNAFWVPECPFVALYRASKPRAVGKLGDGVDLLTASIHEALQFETKWECEGWIAENPYPRFVAREHSIMDVLP